MSREAAHFPILVSQKPGFGSKTLAGYENKFWIASKTLAGYENKFWIASKTLAGYENKFWSLKNQVLDPKH
jgi:hypothetical protein